MTYASERCIQELLSASESSRAGGGDGWKVLAFQNGVEISKRSAGSLHVFRSRWLLRSVSPQQFIVVATAIDAAKVSSNTLLCSVIYKHREASSDLSFRSSSRIQREWQAIPCSSMDDSLALGGRWEARSDNWLDLPMGVHMTCPGILVRVVGRTCTVGCASRRHQIQCCVGLTRTVDL